MAGFLLANGALNDGDTLDIRKKLIQNDKVEAIIVLPRELFITTDISVTLWILNQNKKGGNYHGRALRNREHEILFMDLRQWTENPVKGEGKRKFYWIPTRSTVRQASTTLGRTKAPMAHPMPCRSCTAVWAWTKLSRTVGH